ncbi:BGTF surface domain-containing protein [Halobaculum marinum]|uniref:BGTF surface domain-containing protein n=1 Tax=Halobaculum marinum TaxID=3031996 RepID=UPI0023E3ABCD|nr:BGTF surface domain-containing protein [Halobaculum sp. DT55]
MIAVPPESPPASTDAASAAFVYAGDAITVEAEPRQAIRGETTLDPGTEVTVSLRSTGDTEPRFVQRETVTVTPDGTFTAAVDFSQQRGGGTFSARLLYDGEVVDEAPGEIVASDGSTPGPTATPAEASSTPSTTTERTDERFLPGFPKSLLSGTVGDSVSIEITVSPGGTATLRIGGEEAGYETSATVRDDDGDGSVTVVFDTAAASDPERVLAVADDGDTLVSTTSDRAVSVPLDPGDYDLALYEGGHLADDDHLDDVGSLRLQSAPETESATPTTTPQAATPTVTTATSLATTVPLDGLDVVSPSVLGAGALVVGVLLGGAGVVLVGGALRR